MNEELARFAAVVKARKTPAELLDLFEKLQDSNKFSQDCKPECFVLLLQDTLKRIPDKDLKGLILMLSKLNTLDFLRSELDAQLVAPLAILIAKRMMQAAEKTSEGYMSAFQALEMAQVAYGRIETLELCAAAGLSAAVVDSICNLTYKAYYEEAPRAYFSEPVFA